MSPPDALREALGQVIADQRREWRREREVIEAQARESEARSQQTIAELRAQIVELFADLRARFDARLAEVKDGAPGERGEPGPQGERGEIGPAGRDGLDGVRGERGETGEPGPMGEQGPQGVPGVAGERGEQGLPGEPGPQGERGLQGERGDVGEKGDSGASGADGAPGERGEQGPAGERGERGDPGTNGANGAPGPKGDTGERGESGAQGERGLDGAPGKLSAVREWEDRVHRDGEAVTFGGSVYQALRDTGKQPPHGDWICIASAGRDGRSLNPRGTWAPIEKYDRLDVVVLDGGAFVAKRGEPGPCPGEGWQLLVQRGKSGKQGDKGDGIKGPKGDPGPAVVAIDIDGEGIVTLTNADGTTARGDFYPVLSRIAR